MIVIGLRVGTICQCDQRVPGDQYWFRSAQRMLRNLAAMKMREKQPVCDAKGGFGEVGRYGTLLIILTTSADICDAICSADNVPRS